MTKRIISTVKSDPVLFISLSLAAASCIAVRPDRTYAEYIDFRMLALLFCLMAVIQGFSRIGLLGRAAAALMRRVKNTRQLSLCLTLVCFFSSMLMTNDVALITFVPLTIFVFSRCGQPRRLMVVVAIETVAANLGSLLTPIGNPQNLYLYSFYRMRPAAFFAVTLPLALISFFLVTGLSLLVPAGRLEVSGLSGSQKIDSRWLIEYSLLFALSVLAVFSIVDWLAAFLCVLTAFLLSDRQTLRQVDYSLLVTFVCFFVFVGNIGRIETVRIFLEKTVGGHELLSGVLLSQLISNVPAAVMLSRFTQNGAALIAGTNIGGLGTLVASLASLISFRLYAKSDGARPAQYLGVFTLINAVGLLVLLLFAAAIYA